MMRRERPDIFFDRLRCLCIDFYLRPSKPGRKRTQTASTLPGAKMGAAKGVRTLIMLPTDELTLEGAKAHITLLGKV